MEEKKDNSPKEVNPSTPSAPSAPNPSSTPKFSMFMLVAALVVVVLCMLGLLILYYFYNKDQDDAVGGDDQQSEQEEEDTNEEDADSETETEEVATTTEFVGTYVSADLPTGWTITEYEDGTGGYGMFPEGTYDGLTAFTVSNPADEVVFKVEGVEGIGGTGECSEVYQFADTEASYVTSKQDEAVGLGSAIPPVVDLAGQDYVDFDLFGLEGRFLGNAVYWNVADVGSSAFNPACNMLQVVLDDSGLSFEYTYSGSTSTVDNYMPAATDEFAYIEAEELGAILESIVVN